MGRGHIELDRTVASIRVGPRHRRDLGDLTALTDSITEQGLLQPITVTSDGLLVCGARRLAAIKRLGWHVVNVWVRSGISGRLEQVLAEQDENTLHKPLSKLEAAALYRELKTLMAEDAARRQTATRFGSARQHEGSALDDGAAKFAGPRTWAGETRKQAAAMIPGGASHTTLEKVGYLQDVADDPNRPPQVKAKASDALAEIDSGGPVDPAYRSTRATDENRSELRRRAEQTIERAHRRRNGHAPDALPQEGAKTSKTNDEGGAARRVLRYPTRALVHTWEELAEWWTHYDPDALVSQLTDEQADVFLRTAEGTTEFAERFRVARRRLAEPEGGDRRHLRAI